MQILPPHIEDTIRAIAKLQASHDEDASPLQRAVDRVTGFVGQPRFLIVITLVVLSWLALNLGAKISGFAPLDPPPFAWLEIILSITALYLTTLILATQRYAERLAGYREQLTLELAILTEQKTSKIIELLEEQRRDNPLIKNRLDAEAHAMAAAVDPERVLEAIKDAHDGVEGLVETRAAINLSQTADPRP